MSPKDRVSPVPPAGLEELSGTVLEQRYELGRVLGAGGMGAVFEARHLRLDRTVAIKVLRPKYAAESEYIERFLREAKAASKIRHRNVVELLDYGEAASGLVYSVMEFLEGRDLQQVLNAQPDKRLPWSQACGLLVQIASGLKAAHGQQVIHRDIKPANCFLTEEDGDPVVKVVDFGIARMEGGDRGDTLTGTAQVLGTPSYIAPELVRTQIPASVQSDIYALGVVAYRMLIGAVPFTGETVFEILRHACFDPVPSMREQVPSVPAAVERFVGELLAKEPEQRPADMQAVRERLLVLGRETIGPSAAEISSASGLSLQIQQSITPTGRTADTTLPRKVAEGPAEPPPPGEIGITAVMLPAVSDKPMPPLPPPPGNPRVVVAPGTGPSMPASTGLPTPASTGVPGHPPTGASAVVPAAAAPAALGAIPQAPLYDPTSAPGAAPSRPGETVPAIGESTLRSLEQSGSLDRPPSRGGLWVGLGAAGLMAVIGAVTVPAMMGDEPTATSETARIADAPTEPLKIQPREPAAPAEPSGTTPSSTTPRGAAPSDTTPSAVDGAPGPAGPEGGGSPAGAGEASSTVESPPQDKPSRPRSRPKSSKPPKPKGPPTDSTLIKRLERTIASKCDGSATLKFIVTTTGGVMGATATGPAAKCAKSQLSGTKFRPRKASTPLKITVK